MLISSAHSAEPTTGTARVKKLIEFGWDEPDTAFMRKHIRKMENRPFAGCVFDVMVHDPDGPKRFDQLNWGTRRFTLKEVQPAIDDLKATEFRTMTDNFLRVNVMPGDVDWFDDFGAIIENARLAARVAREGKARGILFDVEPYAKPLWDYSKLRDHATKSFEQYSAQARARGREFMAALQQEDPDINVLLTFAYSLAHMQTGGDRAKLATVEYGLLPSFLDGMLDAATGNTRIIDGYEISYAYKDAASYDSGVKLMTTDALALVADPEKYKKHFRKSFGVWMDMDWRKYAWNTKDFSKNYYTPEAFEKSVRMALQRCDEYVWIYTEKPRWWNAPDGRSSDVPPAYEAALRRAAGGSKP